MTNPYQTPAITNDRSVAAPVWYAVFYYLHRPAWWAGAGLILLSWLQVVSSAVGWIGVGVIGLVWIGCHTLPRLAGFPAEEFVVLTTDLLTARGRAYHHVIRRFGQGTMLVFEELSIAHRPDNELACAIVCRLPDAELDPPAALALARHAGAVIDELKAASPEFSAAVGDRHLRVSVMSSFGRESQELCRVVDDQLFWATPLDEQPAADQEAR